MSLTLDITLLDVNGLAETIDKPSEYLEAGIRKIILHKDYNKSDFLFHKDANLTVDVIMRSKKARHPSIKKQIEDLLIDFLIMCDIKEMVNNDILRLAIVFKFNRIALWILNTYESNIDIYHGPVLAMAAKLGRKEVVLRLLDFYYNGYEMPYIGTGDPSKALRNTPLSEKLEFRKAYAIEFMIKNNMEEAVLKLLNHERTVLQTKERALRLSIAKKMYKVSDKLLNDDRLICDISDFEKAMLYEEYDIAIRIFLHKGYVRNQNPRNQRVLLSAVEQGAWDVCKMLLKSDRIDINYVDRRGRNALMKLITWCGPVIDIHPYPVITPGYTEYKEKEKVDEENRFEIYKMILDRPELDINHQDEDGHTAYTYVVKCLNPYPKGPITYNKLMLARSDINLNVKVNGSSTVWMYAIYSNQDSDFVGLVMDHPNLLKDIGNINSCEYNRYTICKLSKGYRLRFDEIWEEVHGSLPLHI